MSRIDTEADLARATSELLRLDSRLADLLAVAGPLPLRRRAGGLSGLLSIVCSQQLSTASASAIWKRLEAAFKPFDPEAIITARADKLRRAGLSGPKIRAFKNIARAVRDGSLHLERLDRLPAEEAHVELVKVKGIGPWTADIYLLFCIGHADAFPFGDLALQEAARIAFKKRKRPTAKQLEKIAKAWSPWRGVAARLLWAYYRAVKNREAAPVLPKT
jgi:DNA-3-methyladenine glycosylase II